MKNPVEMIEISHSIIEIISFSPFFLNVNFHSCVSRKFIFVGENRSNCVHRHVIKNKKKDCALCVEYIRQTFNGHKVQSFDAMHSIFVAKTM